MIQWVAKVLELDTTVAGAKRMVLVSLANHADAEGYAWPGRRTIAREAGLRKLDTVTDCLTWLVEQGYIERVVNGWAGAGGQIPVHLRPNLYRLVFDKLDDATTSAAVDPDPVHQPVDNPPGDVGSSTPPPPQNGEGVPPETGRVPPAERGPNRHRNRHRNPPHARARPKRGDQDESADRGGGEEAAHWYREWSDRVRPHIACGGSNFLDIDSWPEPTRLAAHRARERIRFGTETEARLAFRAAYLAQIGRAA